MIFNKRKNKNPDCHANARNDKSRHAEFISASQITPHPNPVLDLLVTSLAIYECASAFTLCSLVLHAHRVSPKLLRNRRLNLFAIRTHFIPSVRKSALPQGARGKRAAFTLAEVLITLGIIGVVAALTIPSIVDRYKEQQLMAGLKEGYSILSQAFQYAVSEYGSPNTWSNYEYGSIDGAKTGVEILYRNIKQVAVCYDTKCYPYKDTKSLHNTNVSNKGCGVITASNGMLFWYYQESPTCTRSWGRGKYAGICAELAVDVNGKKGPNMAGVDIFKFYLVKDGIIPFGAEEAGRTFETHCNKGKRVLANGWACTAWVLRNHNMDYLHCNDLSWSGKRKCK